MRIRPLAVALPVLALVALPSTAFAHPGHADGGFPDGLAHPLTGADHVLAMLAVGLWAGQRGGRARWTLPLAFLASMLVGFALGTAGVAVPGVEAGLLASVLVLGLCVAAAVRGPTLFAAALVGVCALLHGHAHGSEAPAGANIATYGAGFALATASLHAAGIGLAAMLARAAGGRALRFAGAATVAAGLVLVVISG